MKLGFAMPHTVQLPAVIQSWESTVSGADHTRLAKWADGGAPSADPFDAPIESPPPFPDERGLSNTCGELSTVKCYASRGGHLIFTTTLPFARPFST